jgi:hypothetical protein
MFHLTAVPAGPSDFNLPFSQQARQWEPMFHQWFSGNPGAFFRQSRESRGAC